MDLTFFCPEIGRPKLCSLVRRSSLCISPVLQARLCVDKSAALAFSNSAATSCDGAGLATHWASDKSTLDRTNGFGNAWCENMFRQRTCFGNYVSANMFRIGFIIQAEETMLDPRCWKRMCSYNVNKVNTNTHYVDVSATKAPQGAAFLFLEICWESWTLTIALRDRGRGNL